MPYPTPFLWVGYGTTLDLFHNLCYYYLAIDLNAEAPRGRCSKRSLFYLSHEYLEHKKGIHFTHEK